MQVFEQECLEALRPAEERMNSALLEQTRHLSGFALRKTLAQWQRFELIDWIQENVELLSASPCIDPLALETLVQEITATLESALAGLDPAVPMTDEDIEAFDRELMGEAFDSDLDDEELDEFAFDADFQQEDATAQAQRERQSALDKALRLLGQRPVSPVGPPPASRP